VPATEIDCREAMSTARGRSQLEPALVKMAFVLDTSPSLWSLDPETGSITVPGHSPDEIEAALDLAHAGIRLTGLPDGDRWA
jgi:hypothetical protein